MSGREPGKPRREDSRRFHPHQPILPSRRLSRPIREPSRSPGPDRKRILHLLTLTENLSSSSSLPRDRDRSSSWNEYRLGYGETAGREAGRTGSGRLSWRSLRDQLAQFLESVRLTGAVPETAIINGQDLEIVSYLYTWI